MAAHELTIVISYDITRNKVRRRVSKRLELQLTRVQMSVFEGRLKQFAADHLFEELEQMIESGDRLRMYVLSKVGLEKSRSTGGIPLPEESDFWLM